MPNVDLTTISAKLDDSFLDCFRTQYESSISLLKPLNPLLSVLSGSCINEYGYLLEPPINSFLKENLEIIYDTIQKDMLNFLSILNESEFLAPENVQSEKDGESSHNIIEKYNGLFQLLFANANEEEQKEYLFAVSNRFFEYCFQEDTFPAFERLLLNKEAYPLARMLYAVTWYNLAGNGWKNWHEESLKNLKALADEGNQIVYIAGGSELYQLMKAGIYNIKNIDPQLPSQPKYYADGWEFLINGSDPTGGLGDKIVFTFEDRVITMERTDFKVHATTFKARIAMGDVIEIPASTTVWAISDQEGNLLGQYTLERRFCQQSDFDYEPNKALLFSFNELYFIALSNLSNGWNIDPVKISYKLPIVIKQLRRPITKEMIVNMHIACLLNNTDFHYIALGTCIN